MQVIMRITLRNHDLDFSNVILRKSDVQKFPKCSSWQALRNGESGEKSLKLTPRIFKIYHDNFTVH